VKSRWHCCDKVSCGVGALVSYIARLSLFRGLVWLIVEVGMLVVELLLDVDAALVAFACRGLVYGCSVLFMRRSTCCC
jgi:hypothetical protein